MGGQAFDPNAFSVEDLFRAKMARRQSLAKLPLEQKIEIVKKLQQVPIAAMRNEKLIFASFLAAYPELAREIEEWDVVEEWYVKRLLVPPAAPFDKCPDVIALTKSGKKIGVELKSWVNRDQIAAARKQERIQENILKAIGKQPPNKAKHISFVWLAPKQVRFNADDAAKFREQLFALIDQVDRRWPQMPASDQPLRQDIVEFANFPILGKYLNGVRFHRVSRRPLKIQWILFPSPGGFYSPNEMRETLRNSLAVYKTDERYRDLRRNVGLDQIYLIVHYDFKAFAYNSPFDAPNFGFEQAAEFASNTLNGDGGNFDKIFLFHFLWGQEEGRRIM